MTAPRHIQGTVKALGGGGRRVLAIASTESEDRHGDVVRARGLGLARYRENPVVLLNHDHAAPIGRALDVQVKGNEVHAQIRLADEGSDPQADRTYALVKQGILNGISIGFIPKKSRPRKGGGLEITEADLLEISIVSVAANADARIIARSAARDLARARARAWLDFHKMRAAR